MKILKESMYWFFIKDASIFIARFLKCFYNKSVTVDTAGVKLCPNGCSAFVDSGASNIVGPISDIAELNSKLGFDKNGDVDCSSIAKMPSKLTNFNIVI